MKTSFTFNTLKKVIRQGVFLFLAVLAVACLVVFLSLIPPQILKNIIDMQLMQGKADKLILLAGMYIGMLLLIALLDFIKAALLTVFGQKMMKELRIGLLEKLEHLPITYYSKNSAGAVSGRIMNDVDSVNALFSDGIISMMIDCFKIIGIVLSIWAFQVSLGVIVLCLVPLIFLLTREFQRRMLKAQVANLVQLGQVNTHISESIKNVTMIKSFGKEAYMEKRYAHLLKKNYRTIEKVNFYDSCYSPIIQVIRAFTIVIIVMIAFRGQGIFSLSVGMLAAAIEYISNLFAPIENLGMEIQSIQKGVSGIKRIDEFYKEAEEKERNHRLSAEGMIPNASEVNIAFCEVSFCYEEEKPILTCLNLTILPGEKVVLQGRTGAGKSTIFKLLLGLLEPDTGTVTINGVPASDIPHKEKRNIFGYVEQDFQWIEGNISEQITLGEKTITQEQVESVMRLVGLHEVVVSFKEGYQTNENLDKYFSEGQKQLLGIARAIAANPPILLFDEMTANLDINTEKIITSVIQNVCKERTVLTISHRMSDMLKSSKIIYLK